MYPVSNHPVYQTCAYFAAENVQLRHMLAQQEMQICNQQQQIIGLQKEVGDLRHDAQRWAKFKEIIDWQRGDLSSKQLQNIVDHGHREGKK